MCFPEFCESLKQIIKPKEWGGGVGALICSWPVGSTGDRVGGDVLLGLRPHPVRAVPAPTSVRLN